MNFNRSISFNTNLLLFWNQDKTFSGEIIARVLNNYASYRVGKVEISADRLYDKMAGLKVKPGDELSGIKGVSDIDGLIAEKNRLKNEVAQLKEEKRQLEIVNISLQNEIDSLYKTIATLVNRKTSAPATPAPAPATTVPSSTPALAPVVQVPAPAAPSHAPATVTATPAPAAAPAAAGGK